MNSNSTSSPTIAVALFELGAQIGLASEEAREAASVAVAAELALEDLADKYHQLVSALAREIKVIDRLAPAA